MLGHEYVLHRATVLSAQGEIHKNQSIVIQNGRIQWVGDDKDLPMAYQNKDRIFEDCHGRLLTPGLIDCHTHLVYAGHRIKDDQARHAGKSYVDIAQSGGGIVSTVKKTREASFETLVAVSLPRLMAMRQQGVSTVEIKSGYGLDLQTEVKMLKVAKTLGQLTGMRVVTTYLGAHSLPCEYEGRREQYIDYICEEVMPYIASEKLADAIDVFCESIGFTLKETEKVFIKAKDLGFKIKAHAEQLSAMGATALATKFKALSCDHLEHLDAASIELMKQSHTVAVLLPGAYYFTGEQKPPPIHLLRQAQVPMAIATDCNPGTSPTTSLPLMMHMACRFWGLSTIEAWQGVTINAAKALGLQSKIGEIAPGKMADLIRWDTSDYHEICYFFGTPIKHELMIGGLWTSV